MNELTMTGLMHGKRGVIMAMAAGCTCCVAPKSRGSLLTFGARCHHVRFVSSSTKIDCYKW